MGRKGTIHSSDIYYWCQNGFAQKKPNLPGFSWQSEIPLVPMAENSLHMTFLGSGQCG